jgi:antitoxin VapB
MPERAKIFQNGGSQAVRLPKSCRFEGQDELVVRRVGRKVILEPADDWSSEFLACLGAWKEEIPRPETQPIAGRKNPFERR